MKDGRWLAPRYTERAVFEKDYPGIDISALELCCPGCRASVRLARKAPSGRIAGWCKACNRAVCV